MGSGCPSPSSDDAVVVDAVGNVLAVPPPAPSQTKKELKRQRNQLEKQLRDDRKLDPKDKRKMADIERWKLEDQLDMVKTKLAGSEKD